MERLGRTGALVKDKASGKEYTLDVMTSQEEMMRKGEFTPGEEENPTGF